MAASTTNIDLRDVKHCKHCGAEFHRPPDGDVWYFRRKRLFCSLQCAGAGTHKHQPLSDRLFEKVARSRPDGCWYWTGSKTAAGYGTFSFHNRDVYAHRVSYELSKGPIPKGLSVCHECDHPACVNPKHLFLGTQRENLADMRAKGRAGNPAHAIGIDHHGAKLTEEMVMAIRSASGKQRDIAAQYGIAQSTLSAIVLRKTWRHI